MIGFKIEFSKEMSAYNVRLLTLLFCLRIDCRTHMGVKKNHENGYKTHIVYTNYERFLVAYATLDSTPKQCSGHLTDSKELKNSRFHNLIHSIILVCRQGQIPSGWLVSPPPGSESKNR